jgi:hypothetical protein
MTEDNPAAERLLRQREAVAKEFGLDISDWRVRQLALLEARLAAAEDQAANSVLIDIGQLLALTQAIADMRQALKASEHVDITVHYVSAVTGIFNCTKCGHRNEIADYKPPAPPPPRRAAGSCLCAAH